MTNAEAQCRNKVFTSTETRRLVRTDSPGRPPRLTQLLNYESVEMVLYFLTGVDASHVTWVLGREVGGDVSCPQMSVDILGTSH